MNRNVILLTQFALVYLLTNFRQLQSLEMVCIHKSYIVYFEISVMPIGHGFSFFKPPPPVGAGGGYMFSGRPSVPLSVRASMRPSVIHVVVLCFRDISSICWRIFAKLLSLVHLGTDELIKFWGQNVKVQGHTIVAEAHSTRRYRRVQLFLVWSWKVMQNQCCKRGGTL